MLIIDDMQNNFLISLLLEVFWVSVIYPLSQRIRYKNYQPLVEVSFLTELTVTPSLVLKLR